jgi:hypothetical protein
MPKKKEKFDPRLRRFILDLNAICLWEENTGRTYEQLDKNSMRDFRMLVWCGLKTQIPEITLEQVGSMLTVQNAAAIKAFVDEMISGAVPEAEAKNAAPRPIG